MSSSHVARRALHREAMLLTDGDSVLLDLFDGDRPAWTPLSVLETVEVFRPDTDHVFTAA
jgi:hypothetical protein